MRGFTDDDRDEDAAEDALFKDACGIPISVDRFMALRLPETQRRIAPKIPS